MENTVSTAMRSYNQLHQYLGIPALPVKYTTLNEKFNIQENAVLTDGEVSTLNYLCIGRGGHTMVMGADNVPMTTGYDRDPTYASLFKPTPFAMRRLNDDFSPSERAKYRLRRIENHNEVQYACYYARTLDKSNLKVSLELRTVNPDDNTVVVRPYVPTVDNLKPVPRPINTGEVYKSTGDYVAASAKIDFIMDSNDIEELINCSKILFQNESAALFSEIALCTGVDRVVSSSSGGTTINYLEGINVQVASFISTYFEGQYWRTGARFTLDVGNAEPLATLTKI